MSYGTLLSGAGTQALLQYQRNGENLYYLNQISTDNSYTNTQTGFNASSIFDNSSGFSSSYTTQNYNTSTLDYSSIGNPAFRGSDGLNRRGKVSYYETRRCAVPAQNDTNPYPCSVFGSSLIGNYFTSIQNVALGQYAPTSVFEQRLNYHLDFEDQKKPGALLGNFSNYFNTESVANNQSETSNYNVYASTSTSSNNVQKTSGAFGSLTASNNVSKAIGASSVSEMMGIFGSVNMNANTLNKNTKKAAGTKNTAQLMSLMA